MSKRRKETVILLTGGNAEIDICDVFLDGFVTFRFWRIYRITEGKEKSMKYLIQYSCLSHKGNIRSINQDNFICNRRYIGDDGEAIDFSLDGIVEPKQNILFGIFDGMGGEECGEIASLISARDAFDVKIGKNAVDDLLMFCHKANNDICDYASAHKIYSMGTTAAMLAFTRKEIILCNIGDSKIFRFSDGIIEQISTDHLSVAAFGMKPPLSQNLGIPQDELIIDPYFARGLYNDNDIYLICSDGLTDMVSVDEICKVIVSKSIKDAITDLLDKALMNGGKDNVSIILCKIIRRPRCFFNHMELINRKEV